ncbi:cytochrome c biogenesis CcdA family protein [Heliomicrobium modesticaldum]|nr:cytochrome c biogenesis protein CcdA [Heliomicrobium modesticaldum]
MQGHWLAMLFVFLGGLLTSIGPCNLSMAPVLFAYIAGTGLNEQQGPSRGDWRRGLTLSLSFTLGTACTFVLLGLLIAFVGGLFGFAQQAFIYLAAFVCLLMGLVMVGALPDVVPSLSGLFGRLGQGMGNKGRQFRGHGGAFFLGLFLGLTGSQCGTPVLLAILGYVLSQGALLYGAMLLFLYAIGRGVPLIAIGTVTGFAGFIPRIAPWGPRLERGAGGLLILLALFMLWNA